MMGLARTIYARLAATPSTIARGTALVWGLALAGCLAAPVGAPPAQAADRGLLMDALRASSISEYQLGPNDSLRITVYGEEDLSGEFDVDPSGFVSLPLVGEVKAGGRTVRQLEGAVADKYRGDYLVNPAINVEVLEYRPFFIVGEVTTSGSYPFEPEMTILKAVTKAGGYTTRANRNKAFLTRRSVSENEIEVDVNSTIRILPGDVIRVGERFF